MKKKNHLHRLSDTLDKKHLRLKIFILAFSCAYFILFVLPNLTGAKDPNMLVVKIADEYLQFPYVIKVTSLGESFYQTIKNVLIPGHYHYGYPFYIISALAILPLRIFSAFSNGPTIVAYTGQIIPVDYTTAYMFILRQLNLFFTIPSVFLLVYLWNGFKSLTASTLLTILLASMPAFFLINMVWHPDSMASFFVILTIFFLSIDNLRFSKWFYLAAIFCGLATGIKAIGLFFFLTVPIYLLLGLNKKSISFKSMIRHGAVFFLVMVVVVIVTNPLLLIPEGREKIFSALSSQSKSMSGEGPPQILLWYNVTLKDFYGFWWFYLLAVCAAILGLIYDKSKRLLNIIILTWALPFSLYLLLSVKSFWGICHVYYFIPIMLPLLSCIGNPIIWKFKTPYAGGKKAIIVFFRLLLLVLCGVQLTYYTRKNFDYYSSFSDKDNKQIVFYHKFNDAYLSKLPNGEKKNIYRDVKIYLPPSKNIIEKVSWGPCTYDKISPERTDLILLRQSDIESYSNRPDIDKKIYKFYQDAKNDSIKGFNKIFHTDYCAVFEKKDEIYKQ